MTTALALQGQTRLTARRLLLFGVPAAYVGLTALHPIESPQLGDATDLWLAIHAVQLFLVAGMAAVFWTLVAGVDGRAARLVRALVVPYAVAYAALDSVMGLAVGVQVASANAMAADDQSAAERFLDQIQDHELIAVVLNLAGSLAWLTMAVAAVVALRRTVSGLALTLLATGAVVFGVGHPRPFGPVGMSLILGAIVWMELRPRSTR